MQRKKCTVKKRFVKIGEKKRTVKKMFIPRAAWFSLCAIIIHLTVLAPATVLQYL